MYLGMIGKIGFEPERRERIRLVEIARMENKKSGRWGVEIPPFFPLDKAKRPPTLCAPFSRGKLFGDGFLF
jgi:hypothetical protein